MSGASLAQQRLAMEEARGVAEQLRALPPGNASLKEGADLLLKVAGIVWRLREGVADVEDASARDMWEQRVSWMHDEVIALAAERLDPEPGEGSFWDRLVEMLYRAMGTVAAAETARDRALQEAEKTASALGKAEEHARELQGRVDQMQAQLRRAREWEARCAAAEAAADRKTRETEDVVERLQRVETERRELTAALRESREAEARLEQYRDMAGHLSQALDQAQRAAEEGAERIAELETQLAELRRSGRLAEAAPNAAVGPSVAPQLPATGTPVVATPAHPPAAHGSHSSATGQVANAKAGPPSQVSSVATAPHAQQRVAEGSQPTSAGSDGRIEAQRVQQHPADGSSEGVPAKSRPRDGFMGALAAFLAGDEDGAPRADVAAERRGAEEGAPDRVASGWGMAGSGAPENGDVHGVRHPTHGRSGNDAGLTGQPGVAAALSKDTGREHERASQVPDRDRHGAMGPPSSEPAGDGAWGAGAPTGAAQHSGQGGARGVAEGSGGGVHPAGDGALAGRPPCASHMPPPPGLPQAGLQLGGGHRGGSEVGSSNPWGGHGGLSHGSDAGHEERRDESAAAAVPPRGPHVPVATARVIGDRDEPRAGGIGLVEDRGSAWEAPGDGGPPLSEAPRSGSSSTGPPPFVPSGPPMGSGAGGAPGGPAGATGGSRVVGRWVVPPEMGEANERAVSAAARQREEEKREAERGEREAARAARGGGGGFLLGFAGRALRAGRQLMEYAAGDVRAERGSQKEGGEVVGEADGSRHPAPASEGVLVREESKHSTASAPPGHADGSVRAPNSHDAHAHTYAHADTRAAPPMPHDVYGVPPPPSSASQAPSSSASLSAAAVPVFGSMPGLVQVPGSMPGPRAPRVPANQSRLAQSTAASVEGDGAGAEGGRAPDSGRAMPPPETGPFAQGPASQRSGGDANGVMSWLGWGRQAEQGQRQPDDGGSIGSAGGGAGLDQPGMPGPMVDGHLGDTAYGNGNYGYGSEDSAQPEGRWGQDREGVAQAMHGAEGGGERVGQKQAWRAAHVPEDDGAGFFDQLGSPKGVSDMSGTGGGMGGTGGGMGGTGFGPGAGNGGEGHGGFVHVAGAESGRPSMHGEGGRGFGAAKSGAGPPTGYGVYGGADEAGAVGALESAFVVGRPAGESRTSGVNGAYQESAGRGMGPVRGTPAPPGQHPSSSATVTGTHFAAPTVPASKAPSWAPQPWRAGREFESDGADFFDSHGSPRGHASQWGVSSAAPAAAPASAGGAPQGRAPAGQESRQGGLASTAAASGGPGNGAAGSLGVPMPGASLGQPSAPAPALRPPSLPTSLSQAAPLPYAGLPPSSSTPPPGPTSQQGPPPGIPASVHVPAAPRPAAVFPAQPARNAGPPGPVLAPPAPLGAAVGSGPSPMAPHTATTQGARWTSAAPSAFSGPRPLTGPALSMSFHGPALEGGYGAGMGPGGGVGSALQPPLPASQGFAGTAGLAPPPTAPYAGGSAPPRPFVPGAPGAMQQGTPSLSRPPLMAPPSMPGHAPQPWQGRPAFQAPPGMFVPRPVG